MNDDKYYDLCIGYIRCVQFTFVFSQLLMDYVYG